MNSIPNHIAFIMDGNGRWAKKNGLSRFDGHKEGSERVEEIVEACKNIGVKYATFYAFSDENWKRPQEEVNSLMELLSFFLKSKCEKMIEKGVKFRTIGDASKLPERVLRDVEEVELKTKSCSDIDMILALSYGSRSEITRALNKLLAEGKNEITPEDIDNHLDAADVPSPDLLVRTSGEYRLSNFMLWQLAYAELYFTDILWPEFKKDELIKAVDDYKGRERRYGRIVTG